ncbi:hypothetical protein GIB67_037186 [Kingdonia uniflora]|uniref:Secoisolariciresinol dehydrogenase n=1 Tax=Kingdonia uniflora TaxID=39325 RepID=A0A7J7MRX3_9MAGN|nr:hypothetical protein GIB67_037186 [Kingdonia uniflora]
MEGEAMFRVDEFHHCSNRKNLQKFFFFRPPYISPYSFFFLSSPSLSLSLSFLLTIVFKERFQVAPFSSSSEILHKRGRRKEKSPVMSTSGSLTNTIIPHQSILAFCFYELLTNLESLLVTVLPRVVLWKLKLVVKSDALLLLLGKVALVTGGASGIGERIVVLFHRHGAKVCIVDVQEELGQRLCESLGGDCNVSFFRCDVTVEDDMCRAFDFTVDKFGALDIVVNNAGMSGSPTRDIRNVDITEFGKVFDLNVKGIFIGMKHAARIMIPRARGSIVSLSSVASAIGGVGPHAYTGSKHAIVGLTKNVAAELGAHGIRVNCVSPYAVATQLALAHLPEEERTEDAWESFRAFVGTHANLKGVELTASDVADTVLYLSSDEARYISGVNLMVDGGFSCVNHSLRVFR